MSYAAMFLSTACTAARTAVASDAASTACDERTAEEPEVEPARTTMNGFDGGFCRYQVYSSGEGSASSPLWRTSPITPTIVAAAPGAVPRFSRRPTGSSPG